MDLHCPDAPNSRQSGFEAGFVPERMHADLNGTLRLAQGRFEAALCHPPVTRP